MSGKSAKAFFQREGQLHRAVRKAVADALEADAEGGEGLLKEVWEECATDEDIAVVTAYAKELARDFRAGGAS